MSLHAVKKSWDVLNFSKKTPLALLTALNLQRNCCSEGWDF